MISTPQIDYLIILYFRRRRIALNVENILTGRGPSALSPGRASQVLQTKQHSRSGQACLISWIWFWLLTRAGLKCLLNNCYKGCGVYILKMYYVCRYMCVCIICLFQAYSSLGQDGIKTELFTSEPVLRIAKENNASPAQVHNIFLKLWSFGFWTLVYVF